MHEEFISTFIKKMISIDIIIILIIKQIYKNFIK